MKVDAVVKKLNTALRLQYRSTLQYTIAAGSIRGFEHLATGELLSTFATAELGDARRLIEKIVALGGEPTTSVAKLPYEEKVDACVDTLVANEEEALAALHAIIPDTGQEPRSEALEHLIEHLILRKQSQVDTLLRGAGKTE
jgi:bacterioferritin (cytochrome b1)